MKYSGNPTLILKNFVMRRERSSEINIPKCLVHWGRKAAASADAQQRYMLFNKFQYFGIYEHPTEASNWKEQLNSLKLNIPFLPWMWKTLKDWLRNPATASRPRVLTGQKLMPLGRPFSNPPKKGHKEEKDALMQVIKTFFFFHSHLPLMVPFARLEFAVWIDLAITWDRKQEYRNSQLRVIDMEEEVPRFWGIAQAENG